MLADPPLLCSLETPWVSDTIPLLQPWSAVERTWRIEDSQDHILALAFRQKSANPFNVFPLHSGPPSRRSLETPNPQPSTPLPPSLHRQEDLSGFRFSSLNPNRAG